MKVEGSQLFVDPNTLDPKNALLQPIKGYKHPIVRRWDGVGPVGSYPLKDKHWVDLEDGLQIKFCLPNSQGTESPVFRTGDYWLIPARVAIGEIEWPIEIGSEGKPITGHDENFIPIPQPPHGVEHNYAPLGWVWWDNDCLRVTPCNCFFRPHCGCFDPEKEKHLEGVGSQSPLTKGSEEATEIKAKARPNRLEKQQTASDKSQL